MAIVSFWSNSERETGQTLSTVATATEMAIEHNNKILIISTGFKEKTIENCFWDNTKNNEMETIIGRPNVGLNNGVEGLIKVIQSNRTSTNIVSDYAKVVFKDRLDILPAPATENIEEYNSETKVYPQIAKIASRDYDFVFVDIDRNMQEEDKKAILEQSDIIVITLKQGLVDLNNILNLKENSELFKKNNVILLAGKYDKFSKYNVKNMTRYLKETKAISAISYNTLFFEAAMEGKVADFFLRYRSISDTTDRNTMFMDEANKTCENIIFKAQELRMRM